jgi:hypothetical protein
VVTEKDMAISKAGEMFLILCGVVGALHVLAPDHWLPTAIVAWQRGWRTRRIAAFASLAFAGHILLGFLIYFILKEALAQFASPISVLTAAALAWVCLFAVIRGIRFTRIKDVFRAGPEGIWGIVAAFSLLGPCESVILIFIKARQMGLGYFMPFTAFLAGTLIAGIAAILVGQVLWNRPLALPRSLAWANWGGAVLPSVAALALGVGVLWGWG